MSLKISLLSQNGLPWNFEKSEEISDFNDFNPDVFVEMTQEDRRPPNVNKKGDRSSLTQYIEGQLLNFLTSTGYEEPFLSSLHDSFNRFNVVLKIYLKKGIKATKLEHGKIRLQSRDGLFWSFVSNFITTKGAVYIKIIVDGKKILFVNMHLASDIGEMGNKIRKKSLIYVIKQLTKKKVLDDETTLIFGGDLNFRIDREVKIDQLTDFLRYSTDIYGRKVSEFIFKSEADKKFTCKFRNIEKTSYKNGNFKKYSDCRVRNEPASIDDTNTLTVEDSNEINKIQEDCGVPNRYPSRCDRFLYSLNEGMNIEFAKYTGIYLQSVKSDHNAIYANITLDHELIGGKNKKHINSKTRKIKQKRRETKRKVSKLA